MTAVAFSIAQRASSVVIGVADGSKYCAVWRVRRIRSNVGFANATMVPANWAEIASSTVMFEPSPPVGHAGEHRNPHVDVVMDLDPGLRVGRPEDPPDVLDDAALELDREREEERVERRAVESLAQEACGRGQDQTTFKWWLGESLDHRRPLAQLAVEHEWFQTPGRERVGDCFQVLGPPRE